LVFLILDFGWFSKEQVSFGFSDQILVFRIVDTNVVWQSMLVNGDFALLSFYGNYAAKGKAPIMPQ